MTIRVMVTPIWQTITQDIARCPNQQLSTTILTKKEAPLRGLHDGPCQPHEGRCGPSCELETGQYVHKAKKKAEAKRTGQNIKQSVQKKHQEHHGTKDLPEPEPPERRLDLGRSLHVVMRSLRGGSEAFAIGDGCKGAEGRRAKGAEGALRAGVAAEGKGRLGASKVREAKDCLRERRLTRPAPGIAGAGRAAATGIDGRRPTGARDKRAAAGAIVLGGSIFDVIE